MVMRSLRTMSMLAVALGLGLVAVAPAQVYRSVDADGQVTYSDSPGPGSERIEVAPLQTYSAPPPAAASAAPAPEADAASTVEGPPAYRVSISSPGDDDTLRDNAGTVSVSVQVSPALREQERLRLLLDGRTVQEPGSATSFALEFVDRGSHVLTAEVIGAGGSVLARSDPVTFHLHRFARQPAP